jgi:hypothetical protein
MSNYEQAVTFGHGGGSGSAPAPTGPAKFRDRIKELRWVRAGDLVPNPKNWRRHPQAQRDALCGLLTEIGYADALLVRELPEGRLMIIDGHLRADIDGDALVPVLVLDLNEEEADKLLLTLDPLAAMAESDSERIQALLETVQTKSEAVEQLIRRTAGEEAWQRTPKNRASAFIACSCRWRSSMRLPATLLGTAFMRRAVR